MTTTTVRVLIGSLIAACVLAIGALEVVSERVHVDPAATFGQGAPDRGADSSSTQVAALEFQEEAGPSPAGMSSGQAHVSAVSKSVTVVSEERHGANLAMLECFEK